LNPTIAEYQFFLKPESQLAVYKIEHSFSLPITAPSVMVALFVFSPLFAELRPNKIIDKAGV